jgi:2',3'-cyclic-nucleotide 2'-phosphodiesterase (5'-nucleotidase family)
MNFHLYKYFILLLTTLFFSCSNLKPDKISFIILQLNDVYEIAPMNKGKEAGLARVATLRKQLLTENKNTITVMAGDFLSPSLIGTMKVDGQRVSGEHMVEALNAVELDYATFGNHEFDLKEKDLLKRLNESAFEWTSANSFHQTDSGINSFNQRKKPIPKHLIHEFESEAGTKFNLGIVSVTLPFNKTDFVSYDDPSTAFKNTYESIKANCDAVIGLTHLSLKDDITLAQDNPELLMILGGHEHANSSNLIGNVTINKADANAKTVYVHRISIDLFNGQITINSELVAINDKIEEDVTVKQVVDKWQSISDENLNKLGYNPSEVVFETTEALDVLESNIRNGSTNFTKLVMEAYKFGYPNADVFFCNSGSIRLDDKLTGSIFQKDILKTFPYGGSLAVADINGKMLKDILMISMEKNKNTGGFLQMGGISYDDGIWKINTEDIDSNKIYKVLIPSFVAAGNEQNLSFIKTAPTTKPEFLGPNKVKNDVRDLVIDYLKSKGSNP